MKRSWIIYVIALAVSGALVYFYPNRIFAAVFYLLLCIPVFSLMLLLLVYLRFKLRHSLSTDRIIKGDNVVYTCTIYNDDIIPYPEMRVVFEGEHLIFHNQTFSQSILLMPKSKFDINITFSCKYRGIYYIGVKYVEITDFFNLFKIKFRNFSHKKILAYPKIKYFRNLYVNRIGNIENGNKDVKKIHADQSLAEIKNYEYGEKLSMVHWKLSTRLGKLMSKKMESMTEEKYTVYIDLFRSPLSFEENIILEDKLIEVFVSFVNVLLSHDIPFDLKYMHIDEFKEEKYVNHTQFDMFFENAANMQFTNGINICSLITGIEFRQSDMFLTRGKLFVFTFNLSAEIIEQLEIKIIQGYSVFLFLVSLNEFKGHDIFSIEEESAVMTEALRAGIKIHKLEISDDIEKLLEGEII
jgi:hypothetical protein